MLVELSDETLNAVRVALSLHRGEKGPGLAVLAVRAVQHDIDLTNDHDRTHPFAAHDSTTCSRCADYRAGIRSQL